MNKRLNQVIIHVIGCLVFLAFPILFSPDLSTTFEFIKVGGFQRDFLYFSLLILFFYFSYFFLIPKFYFRKRYVLFYVLSLLCFLFVFLLPLALISSSGYYPEAPRGHFFSPFNPDYGFPPSIEHFFFQELRMRFFQFFVVFIFSLMLRVNYRWKKSEEEKLSTELSFLKAQINPHFLFNTLNSIYSSAIEEKAKNTSSAIVKLSGLMRYIISEGNTDFVSLAKELDYISDYVELQKIRLGNTIQLSYNVTGSTEGKRIAPLILIPFIENAFKYGVNPEETSDILINIGIVENKLTLHVSNKKVYLRPSIERHSGLGLENTKGRLQLSYPQKHKLTISNEARDFIVLLQIDL